MEKLSPKLAVFISGSGTNLQALINARKNGKLIAEIALVVSSSPQAGGLVHSEKEGIPTFVFQERKYFSKQSGAAVLLEKLKEYQIKFIALAGYLKLLAPEVIAAFENKIINIHPGLLPKYGGKGMYGMHVHEAVIAAQEKESGVTFHLVDDKYDHGRIVKQIKVPVYEVDTPGILQLRIQKEEHRHYPIVLNEFIEGKI